MPKIISKERNSREIIDKKYKERIEHFLFINPRQKTHCISEPPGFRQEKRKAFFFAINFCFVFTILEGVEEIRYSRNRRK